MRLALLWATLAALTGAAHAQLTLVIDGRTVGEVRTNLVSGHSYAPADALAGGLGATLAAPAGTAVAALTLGGHVVQIDVVDAPTDAQRAGAVRADGGIAGGLAAVRGDDALWLPVTPVVTAFGAQVSFLPDRDAVVVVSPRPTLTNASLRGSDPEEVLTLNLDVPVSWSRFENSALGLTELHLRRARLERARTLDGDVFRRVDLLPESDGVRIRLDAPGASLEIVTLPDGRGSIIRVRARPDAEADDATERGDERRVVIGAGAGAGTTAADGDSDAEALADAVARRLRGEGVDADVAPSRSADAAGGAGADVTGSAGEAARADLFVSLHVAALPSGEVRVWVLGDPVDPDVLQMAVRTNAATALAAGVEDEVRRSILLGLVPDIEAGRRYGRSLATALFQLGGYRAGGVGEAPLAVLEGAAGRGVLLEFSPDDLRDERLPDILAAAIESALGGAP